MLPSLQQKAPFLYFNINSNIMTDLEKLQSLKIHGEEIFQRLREQPSLFTDDGDIGFARIYLNRLKYIDNEINELLVKMYNNKEN